jgi:hypothetical protein
MHVAAFIILAETDWKNWYFWLETPKTDRITNISG